MEKYFKKIVIIPAMEDKTKSTTAQDIDDQFYEKCLESQINSENDTDSNVSGEEKTDGVNNDTLDFDEKVCLLRYTNLTNSKYYFFNEF